MNILYHNDLPIRLLENKHGRIMEHLRNDNFSALDIKKMPETGLYRVKLDYENRLLLKFAKYNNTTYLLLLEIVFHHDYAKSRFLRGKEVQENNLVSLTSPQNINAGELLQLPYINHKSTHFHLLDKVISFDDGQQQILTLGVPLIIIGSAGSGKTVLTLEKIKTLKGKILYITRSPYLVQSSANLYYANHYENEEQEIEFLSYKEFLETLRIIDGREIDYRTFEGWFIRHRNTVQIKDAHKLYEEFGGVITGSCVDKEFLSREEYLSLGVRQSVFLNEEREQAYTLFEKYLAFLKENNYYDVNIISYHWLSHCKPEYDFIVIDEVQDITNVQLFLILKSLSNVNHFILCGDSNQVVHPNFFSWANVKTLFYKNDLSSTAVHILHTNYRNSPQITEAANKLLKIKNLRFGSIDKESSYLVNSIASRKGEVTLIEDNGKNRTEMNNKTKGSTKFAVVVMRSEDKAEAKKIFQTPLLFSVHEAKGLEYENVILLNFISDYGKEFNEISGSVSAEDINAGELTYSRAKDKTDKSHEVYKFYVNSLYVAITRAVSNLYLIESSPNHHLLKLLGLQQISQQVNIQARASSQEDWKKEARKLELQGKLEQAEEIRRTILKAAEPTPWKPITLENLDALKREALDPDNFNKKAKDKLFDFALLNNHTGIMELLASQQYKRAERYEHERGSITRKYYTNYQSDNVSAILTTINKYGVNHRDLFNLTPLMISVMTGAVKITNCLLDNGSDTTLTDNFGRNALQMSLYQSHFSKQFSTAKLKNIYPLVLTDNIKVKVDNRLVKIDNHKIEYFIINYLVALQSVIIDNKEMNEAKGVRMNDLLTTFAGYPETVLPDYRKQRTYLSAHFSKNEISREAPDNKKYYQRVERGFYIFNPEMEIMINDQWHNIYHLMQSDKMDKNLRISSLRKQIVYWEHTLKTLKIDFDAWERDHATERRISELKKNIEALKNELQQVTNEQVAAIMKEKIIAI